MASRAEEVRIVVRQQGRELSMSYASNFVGVIRVLRCTEGFDAIGLEC